MAATAVIYAGHLKSAAGSCHVGFGPQLVNSEKSGDNYSKELGLGLEKCSIGKPQPLQPKLVAVETVDPNRTRPKRCPRVPGELIVELRFVLDFTQPVKFIPLK